MAAKVIRKTCPDAKIVVGGIHPTLFPERYSEAKGETPNSEAKGGER